MHDTGTNTVTPKVLSGMIRTILTTPNLEYQTLMIWGAPGTGKTAMTNQEAKAANLTLIPIHLFMREAVDMRGLPRIDADSRRTFWTTPEFFPQPGGPPPVIFLDEITAADFGIQAVAYQIAYEHRVGEHRLPPGTRVIMAGNRLGDGAVAYTMSTALANRAIHVTLLPNAKEWITWGMGHHIHKSVLGFISFAPHHIYTYEPHSPDPAFSTPRTLEMVSQHAHAVDAGEMDPALFPAFVKGAISERVGNEYLTYRQVYARLRPLQDYIDGAEIPTDIGLRHAVTMQLVDAARNQTQSLDTALQLILRPDFPAEFAVIAGGQLMEVDMPSLIKQPTYPEFSRTYGHLFA